MNEIAKAPQKRGRVPARHKAGADMSWVDRLEPLDADAAAAALERPGPGPAKGKDWVDRFAGSLDEDFARGALEVGEFPSKADYDAAEERNVNKRANVIRKRGKTLVELPDSVAVEPGPLSVRQVGRAILLEPADPPPIPPGYYTPETLPPLGEGAKAILASIDAVAPLVDVRSDIKRADRAPGIVIEDPGVAIELSDDPLPGFDPDR